MHWNDHLSNYRNREFQPMPPEARTETFKLHVPATFQTLLVTVEQVERLKGMHIPERFAHPFPVNPGKIAIHREFLSGCIEPRTINPDDPGSRDGQLSPSARIDRMCKQFEGELASGRWQD